VRLARAAGLTEADVAAAMDSEISFNVMPDLGVPDRFAMARGHRIRARVSGYHFGSEHDA
jgi:hypothetical protein